MSDDRQELEERAAHHLLDAYAKLVAMAAQAIVDGDKAEHLAETIDGMKDSHVRAMLMARIAAEAVYSNELTEQMEAAPFAGLGNDPRLN